MEWEILLALASVAVAAGIVDAIAGGGGLLTVPALLLAGLSPVTALGTNKLQGTFGVASATYSYSRAGLIDFAALGPWLGTSAVCAAIGAVAASSFPAGDLKQVIAAALIVVAAYFALAGDRNVDRPRRQNLSAAIAAVAVIGAYDGFLGPGTGSFFLMAMAALAGYALLPGVAAARALNLASNLGALTVFALVGAVDYKVGAVMALGQIVGGRIGAGLAIRGGGTIIRPVVVFIAIAIALRLLIAG